MTRLSQAPPDSLRPHGPRYNTHLSQATRESLRPHGPRYNKRQFLKLLGAGAGAAAATWLDAPPARAQATGPVKIGVLTIRAGVAAPVGAARLPAAQRGAGRPEHRRR